MRIEIHKLLTSNNNQITLIIKITLIIIIKIIMFNNIQVTNNIRIWTKKIAKFNRSQ